MLPFDVASDELAGCGDDLVAGRLGERSDAGRELAQALSVDGAPVSLERCQTLSPGRSAADVFEALGELVSEQILDVDGERYRFCQQALREAVLEQLEPVRRRQLHRQIALDLLVRAPTFSQQVQAAWHLVRGGEESRGAELIAQAGTRYLTEQSSYDSTPQVVIALQKAHEIYERQGRSEYEIACVLFALVPLVLLQRLARGA